MTIQAHLVFAIIENMNGFTTNFAEYEMEKKEDEIWIKGTEMIYKHGSFTCELTTL